MAKLTSKQRKSLPKSDFAIPSNKNSKNPAGRGAYPIPDFGHARDALSRVAANGTPAQVARVKAAVRKHFPSVKVG